MPSGSTTAAFSAHRWLREHEFARQVSTLQARKLPSSLDHPTTLIKYQVFDYLVGAVRFELTTIGNSPTTRCASVLQGNLLHLCPEAPDIERREE